jgi:SSS family transporter
LVGGDSAGGTLQQLLDGSKTVNALDGVWAFHDITDTWHQIGRLQEPATGGVLAPVNDESCLWMDARTADGKTVPASVMKFLNATKRITTLDWGVIGAYFVGIGIVGFWFARRQKDAEGYALGGRHMKWWATAISMAASHISTISFMAIPALVAGMGLVANSTAIFILATMIFSAYVTFPLLRRLKITSSYAYLEQRFGLSLRLIGSFQSIITQLMGRIGIVVMLPALAISSMTGISPWISVLAMGLFTTIYSTAGGFEAVIWTDVFQGILMFVGFILIGVLSFAHIDGGLDAFMTYGKQMERFNFFITDFDLTLPMLWYSLFTLVIATMSFASDAGTAQRVLATPLKDVRKFSYAQGVISIGVAALSAFVGLSLFAFFKSSPEFLSPVMKNDQMVPIFLVNMVPTGLAGLLLATLFAAAMANVSATVNLCAVMFAEDFYKRFNKKATGRSEMRVMQVATFVSGLFGTGMALWLLSLPMPTLWETFTRIMALLGGGFGGVFILGMFTRRTHEIGAVIGVIVSCFVAYFIQFSELDIHWSGLGLLITLSCIVFGYFSSLIIPWKRKDLTGLTVWDQVKDQVTDEELLARPQAAITHGH